MTELYKKRNFGDLITDTFGFIRNHGKHYFKNYFTINGAFLLIAAVLMYFFSKIYVDFIFGSLQNPMGQMELMESYASWIWAGIAGALLFLLITILHQAFPVIYFKHFEARNGTQFSSSELATTLKSYFGRILVFFFFSLFAIMLPALIVFTLLVVLSVFIIGIPLLIIAIPVFFAFVQQSLFHFLNSDDTYFTSLGEGWNAVYKNFWPVVGSTAVMHILIQVAMGVFAMIIYIVGAIFIFLDIEQTNNDPNAIFSVLGIFLSILFIFSTLSSLIMNNLLFINQAMAYYSYRESVEHKSTFSTINSIGQNFE